MNNPFEEIINRLDHIEKLIESSNKRISENATSASYIADNSKLIKIEEASELTGYKKGYLYELVFRKAIPFIKRGRSIRFDPKELNDWMREGRPNVIQQVIKSFKK